MNDQVLVSVIVPVYNPPIDRMRSCIESILAQTLLQFELILVDDGSESAVKSVLSEYAQSDSRIRLITQSNKGVSAARNTGIDAAAGIYLVFTDADDFIETNFLERMSEAIHGCELCICGVTEEPVRIIDEKISAEQFFCNPERYSALLYINYAVNKLYLKHIVIDEQITFRQDIRLGEDALFLADYLQRCNNIACISDMLYHYIRHEKSSVHNFYVDFWLWEREVIHRQFELFPAQLLEPQQKADLQRWVIQKFRGAFFYYLWNSGLKYSTMLRVILRDPLLQTAMERSERSSLPNKERILAFLWKNAGLIGIIASYLISVLRKKAARIASKLSKWILT